MTMPTRVHRPWWLVWPFAAYIMRAALVTIAVNADRARAIDIPAVT